MTDGDPSRTGAADDAVPAYHRPRRSRRSSGTEWPATAAADRPNVLVVTRGHPFARDPFYDIFESMPDLCWSSVEHPGAQRVFDPDFAAHFDCYVLYDMPGIEFRTGEPPRFFEPPDFYVDGLMRMLDAGFPLVVLHHACAAWPAWPEWAEIVGGHFLYQPGRSRGRDVPDSGYVIDVAHTVTPVGDHPITHGIEPFELVDELYLFQVFEDSVTPLFVSNYQFTDRNFFSAARALEGHLNDRTGWSHPPGSNLVGWVKSYRDSPIVYLQFGDGPATYGNESFRRILANAIRWAASPAARKQGS